MEVQLAQLTQLVQSLHEKLDGVIEENKHLRSLFENTIRAPPKKKEARSQRQQCCGITAKGTQCKNKAVENGRCKMHMNQNSEEVTPQPKQKKQKKQKKQVPVHTHLPGETPVVYCRLCETHGDILDADLPNRCFVISETVVQPEPVQEPEPVQKPKPVQKPGPVKKPKPVQEQDTHNTLETVVEEDGDQDLISQLRNLTTQQTNWADVDDDDFFETS